MRDYMSKSLIIFIFFIFFINGCAKSQEEKELTIADENISIRIEGSVYPSKRQDILSTAAGKVEHLYIKNGDRIHKGDLIYSLNKELIQLDIQNKQNEISSLEKIQRNLLKQKGSTHNLSNVNLAAQELKKIALLHAEGYIQDFELNTFKKNYINSLNNKEQKSSSEYEKLRTLNATITTKKIELYKLQYQLKHTDGYADIDGFIADIKIQQGQSISSDTKVCTIVNLDQVILKAGFATGLLPFIHKNQMVDISFITTPPYSARAAIKHISPIVNPKFNSMTLDIVIPNKHYILQEGTRALVSIKLSKKGQERVKKYFMNNKKEKVIQIQSRI